jgi:putative nucleotidyltransferase with HDIG domain
MGTNGRRFRTRVTLTLIVSMLLVSAVSLAVVNYFGLRSQFETYRAQLRGTAQVLAVSVDQSDLRSVPLAPAGAETAAYRRLRAWLEHVLAAHRMLKGAYVLVGTMDGGQLQFIVDADPPRLAPTAAPAALPGHRYDARRTPALLAGFVRQSADEEVSTDQWGATLSGYAPVVDADGRTIAVLGVDMDAGRLDLARRVFYREVVILGGVSLLAACAIGFALARRVSGPVEQLTQGMRRVASGDFSGRVEVTGHDELAEMAVVFNEMAESLAEARRQLKESYVRTVESLAISLEAKDAYTRGHSERVAVYAERIARRLGLDEEKIGALKKAALLHDIGKIGVPEQILNKPGRLTADEFQVIRAHPKAGGEILGPVMAGDEMLAVVTQHHERCDGRGYPQGVGVSEISLYARITAGADTLDAMCSSRPYRPGMSREAAAAELRRCRGTQLDAQVVDAILEMLEEDARGAAAS